MRLPRGCRINVVVFAQQFPACSSCAVGPFAEGGGRRLMSRVSPSPLPSPSLLSSSSSSLHRGDRLTHTASCLLARPAGSPTYVLRTRWGTRGARDALNEMEIEMPLSLLDRSVPTVRRKWRRGRCDGRMKGGWWDFGSIVFRGLLTLWPSSYCISREIVSCHAAF